MKYIKRFLVGLMMIPVVAVIGVLAILAVILVLPVLWVLMILWWVHAFSREILDQ